MFVGVPPSVHTTASGGREELFDRSRDETEVENVIAEHDELAERLRSAVHQYLESPLPPWGDTSESVELNEMELNQLRALGYSIP